MLCYCTYVKEFVHGDRGRTIPNIAQLLNTKADIIQLDVTGLVDDNNNSNSSNSMGKSEEKQKEQ